MIMKNSCVYILALFLMLISCNEKNEIELEGNYERYSENGNYYLELKKNADYTMNCDNYAMDPNYWYGTYEIHSDSLIFDQHEDFSGSNIKTSYYFELNKDTLTLKKDTINIEWIKTE